ncbi:MAG: hypothetical protein MI923_03820 [Phycisphaerales bacterium]|nr:hypothetical protein [Phycisphaerales bacterium]
MYSRSRKVVNMLGLIGLLSVVICSMGGNCGGISPFLATQFNNNLVDPDTGPIGGPAPPDNGGDDGDDGDVSNVLGSVCDLAVNEQTIVVSVRNEAVQQVEFSMTFVVSAGPGGFVCDAQLQNYLNAGYSDAIVPGSGNNAIIGCDTIQLFAGTRILTLEFGINQGLGGTIPANPTGNPDDSPTFILRRRDTGSPFLPLPELIVFGNEDPDFICTGGAALGDLCTQRGFSYVSDAGIPLGKAAEASRIQGTVCAENFGTAPEWRLDRTLDAQVQPFQFGRGGTIIATVLDRALDAIGNTRNQVVWLVTDANDNTLHFEDR